MSKESKTIFVRNLSYSTTKETLENCFSDYGPIKQCFIVNDKVSGKSRGFGYIKFTVWEDAKKAKESKTIIDGRKVLVDYADISKKKKLPPKRKGNADFQKPGTLEEDKNDVGDDVDRSHVEIIPNDSKDDQKPMKTMDLGGHKYHYSKIVLLSGLPSDIQQEELNQYLDSMDVKKIAECKLVGSNRAHLKFKSIRDAKRTIRKLHNKMYKDSKLQAIQLYWDMAGKMARVIIRNLAFSCKEDDLRLAFEKCGEIKDINIPTNSEGKLLGFGFVQFTRLKDAKKAVDTMNAQKILGRPVAVDWSLPKVKYETSQKVKDDDVNHESSSDENELSSNEQKQSASKKQKHSDDVEGKNKTTIHDDEDENDESEEDEDEDEDEDKDEDEDDEPEDDESEDDESEDDDEDEDDGLDHSDAEFKAKTKKQNKRPEKSDAEDGCTLFIRNLSFDTTEDGLQEYFEQFGELRYAKVVVNPNTEHSKGTGFVKFVTKESADKCMEEAERTDPGISLDGRQLNITKAVSRLKAADFTEKKSKEKKDSRNLYLAREGMIRPGTQAAEGLSKEDLDKRMKVEEVKRQKLQNLNIFISPLRLCVRNIPVNVDDRKLQEIFKTAAGDKKAHIDECRVMRDRARLNAAGHAKSLGYGFVSFTDHQHALAALRSTNNNPVIFGDKRRLIVEFSLENRKALEMKERRKEKFQLKKKVLQNKSEDPTAQKKMPGKSSKSISIPLLELSEKDRKLKDQKALKGLPSHWGPKVRHNKRPGQQVKKNTPQKSEQNKSAKRKADNELQATFQKKKKNSQDFDDFDKMVNKYKSKFLQSKTNTKWFE